MSPLQGLQQQPSITETAAIGPAPQRWQLVTLLNAASCILRPGGDYHRLLSFTLWNLDPANYVWVACEHDGVTRNADFVEPGKVLPFGPFSWPTLDLYIVADQGVEWVLTPKTVGSFRQI